MNNVKQLWEEFYTVPFPEEVAGEEIDGVDVTSIDSAMAGCISTFVDNNGRLDPQRTEILKTCVAEIENIFPTLHGEVLHYFKTLHHLGNVVLHPEKR